MRDKNAPAGDRSGFFKIGILVLAIATVIMAVMLFLPEVPDTAGPAESAAEASGSAGGTKGKDKWSEGDVTYNGKTYRYNTSIKSYLFMGVDREGSVTKAKDSISGGQSDVMFLLVVDKAAERIKTIAINRNTMCLVDVYSEDGTYQGPSISQLCLQHAYGDGMGLSCRRTVEAVERLFYNIPISGYIAMNLDGIRPLNHSVGGVTLTVEEDYTAANGKYEFRAGETVKLSDDEAYVFIRSRDLYEFASADARLARQVSYMNALVGQLKDQMAASPGKAASVYKAVEDYTVASIDAVSLAEKIAGYSFTEEDMLQLPGKTRMGTQFEEYHIDEEAFFELLLDVFYTEVSE